MRILLLLSFCLAPLFAFADTADEMSFEDRVRAYILENPEIILEALTLLSEREQQAELQNRISAYATLFQDPPKLGLGPPDARVRVLEFFDYNCAPCKAMHPELAQAITEAGEIRIEMRHLPILSPSSERAARFALAVLQLHGTQAYGRVHGQLWTWKGPLSHGLLSGIAAQEGLDMARVETAMEADWVTERIAANRDAAVGLGLQGTPAFVSSSSVHIGRSDVSALIAGWLSQ